MTSLTSFKELLLKKADGDTDLQTLIRFVDKDVLSDLLMESLEKMARGRHKGDAANAAVMDFGTEMDPEMEPHMIRDAIGHHVSHYKAALEKIKTAGSDGEKSKAKELADKHAQQAFKLMNLADTVKKHSHGKLDIDYVPPQPWERNKLTQKYQSDHPLVQQGKYKAGDFTTKTKGLNYKGSLFGKGEDETFLEKAPHSAYSKEVKRHGHTGAYPFEQVKVNGKYIHVEDVEPQDQYKDHPFDKHPIMGVFRTSPANRTPEEDANYLKERDKYHESEHIGQFWGNYEDKSAKAPDMGSQPSKSVHKPVDKPLELQMASAPAEAPSKPAQESIPAQAAPSAVRRQPEVQAAPKPYTMSKEAYQKMFDHMKNMGHSDDHIKNKILHNVKVED